MLSRRDKLLIRPWQKKRYENHLRKIQSALPAIDNRPPASRNHVAVKLKRKQSENERCTQIEKDNLILLQKLSCIMRTNRVNNYWATPQPNFLNRVGMYDATPNERLKTERTQDFTKETTRIRTANCLACSPQKVLKPQIPEERIPWEPERPPITRIRSKSVPAQNVISLPTVKEICSSSPVSPSEKKPQIQQEVHNLRKSSYRRASLDRNTDSVKSPQSIILSRGSLVLAVNFPSDTFVTFQDGKSEKLIMRGLCKCKNTTKNVC